MNNSFYNKLIMSFLALFLIVNFVIWHFNNKELISPPKGYSVGELSRLSYRKDFNMLRKRSVNLPKQHIEFSKYNNEKIDIITIGDSFSNGASGSLNPYYQDYIETNCNLKTLNIPLLFLKENESVIDVLIPLLNNGFIDKVKPKYVILQTVERSIGTYLGVDYDFKYYRSQEDFKKPYLENSSQVENKSLFNFISEANFKYLLYRFGYFFSEKPFNSSVYIKKLSRNLFSGKQGNTILFYTHDVEYMKYNNDEFRLAKVNDNLNFVAKKLNEKGVKLIFIAVPDKYDLYYDYINKVKLPKPTFFDNFDKLPKNYIYVDAKKILSKPLKNDQKDLYFQDDTHWSGKAVKFVADELCLFFNKKYNKRLVD